MNFLAHIALSGDRPLVMMGNYTGDFIKGTLTPERTQLWSTDYTLGIRLHRFIDSFTDSHSVVREAKSLLNQKHPKVGGVILDIYFDYFLANHFSDYYKLELAEFVETSYQRIRQHQYLIPNAMLPMVDAMIRHNWLYNYKDVAGIQRSFDGLANRFAFLQTLRGAENELLTNFAAYETAFHAFYPILQQECHFFILENTLP
ncbi:acyl carrier protein phosphodiesterase [Arundinibacter roseus]|uniref:DUF479 domain-containing protein n=1 Tax=Arundinibacter roseus TaxID=2070510 RepID=A0A4R4KJZ6_9BACT|nr:ACP phosphodiesterase [Arundinibacter roseus]TDB66969.1 DUF479 domain-containing protein [Arundinibacter roseus]